MTMTAIPLSDLERMFIMDAIENFLADEHSQDACEVVQALRTKIEGPPGDTIRVLFEGIRKLRARGIPLEDALGLSHRPRKH
jgi:hypothetical protein